MNDTSLDHLRFEHISKPLKAKEGMNVLDPFVGIGSTLVAANRINRIGYGIELNEKYFKIDTGRVPKFKKNEK